LVAAFGVTCKDSSAPNVAPQTVAAAGGDGQMALTGDSLPNPLVVRVTGSDGQPFRGAMVTWTVTGSAATVGSPTVTSDSLGFAATTVTLGATPGVVSVQASVVGLQPANFTATACDHPAIASGDTVSGALATTDCRFNGFYTDFFELTVSPAQGLTLTMTSAAFDTWLELYRGSGVFVAFDDDIDQGVNTNSQITAIVAAGDYLVAPSSYNQDVVGAYSLSAVAGQAALADCGVVWVTRGVAVSDSVTAGDCVDTTGGTHYSDAVAVFLEAGSVLTVLHQSTTFDAALFLLNGAGVSVASNNDSANAVTTTNAYLVYSVLQTGPYLLRAGTNIVAATGPYTLTISASTTLSGSARAERGGGPALLRMAPLRMPKASASWSRLRSSSMRRTI
jgi:hypothetical protein